MLLPPPALALTLALTLTLTLTLTLVLALALILTLNPNPNPNPNQPVADHQEAATQTLTPTLTLGACSFRREGAAAGSPPPAGHSCRRVAPTLIRVRVGVR